MNSLGPCRIIYSLCKNGGRFLFLLIHDIYRVLATVCCNHVHTPSLGTHRGPEVWSTTGVDDGVNTRLDVNQRTLPLTAESHRS